MFYSQPGNDWSRSRNPGLLAGFFLHFYEQVVTMGKLEIGLISVFVSNPMLF
jgi:hypothetical protein